MSTKFEAAIGRIDEENAKDPNREYYQGQSTAKELVYSYRMSEQLDSFVPDAPEALKLAVRAHHICRWEIPRSSYPDDRKGYLQWRNALKTFHADKTADILEEVGYDASDIDRVRFLIEKKQLKKDADTQALEDVICLVFLQHYAEDFSRKETEDKMISILQKTWRKMSDEGQKAALQLEMPVTVRTLVEKALA